MGPNALLADAWMWFGWVLAAAWVSMLWPVWFGLLQRRRLTRVRPLPAETANAPMVSIIVPARDEAREIESALRTFLALDYPHFEVVAIDDRSADSTGTLMDRVAATDPRCRVMHITALPKGWLGKNHANWVGAQAAAGQFLLFTDGDVKLRPETLRHAIAFMQERGVDHFTAFPDTGRGSFWETVMLAYFTLCFLIFTRAPLTRFRWARRAFAGIGAFNLVRRAAYESIGTHERLRMEVADDLMLGKILKQSGFRSDAMLGRPLIYVRWQTGVGGIVRGLEKNAFAGTRYSLMMTTFGILYNLLLGLMVPVLMVTGPGQVLCAFVALSMLLTLAGIALEAGYNPLTALFWPMGAVLFAWILIWSAYLTLRSGGITWRGTFYPLSELKKGMT